jgi:hypothetical protein
LELQFNARFMKGDDTRLKRSVDPLMRHNVPVRDWLRGVSRMSCCHNKKSHPAKSWQHGMVHSSDTSEQDSGLHGIPLFRLRKRFRLRLQTGRTDSPIIHATASLLHLPAFRYESTVTFMPRFSGADTLMMALLKLWAAQQQPGKALELIYTDR